MEEVSGQWPVTSDQWPVTSGQNEDEGPEGLRVGALDERPRGLMEEVSGQWPVTSGQKGNEGTGGGAQGPCVGAFDERPGALDGDGLAALPPDEAREVAEELAREERVRTAHGNGA